MILFDLEDDNIILQTYVDFSGYDFVWFENPINYYNIKNITARISSFEQLRWYAEVFFYLNPDIDLKIFKGLFQAISSTDFGKTVRSYGRARTGSMIEDVYKEKAIPWCRRKRRLIFNPEIIISPEEKKSISATLCKRGVVFTKRDVLDAIEYFKKFNIIITSQRISRHINCSLPTVNRLLDEKTKDIIKFYNISIREEKKILKVVESIQILTSGGDEIKIKSLKLLTAERNYEIIKKAIARFESCL